MGEQQTMAHLKHPNTRVSLAAELQQLGIKPGMVVIVHSSLKSLGWVCGGSVAVVEALMDTIGCEGTIVMPTQTGDYSDPSEWHHPPVPKEWWKTIRATMPAYDPKTTPTRGMGKIVETFRTFPDVKRSNHPTYSFAAWGKYAEDIISEQPLNAGFGKQSPLGKIYALDGYILLLGVGHDSNTSLHLAEHAIPHRQLVNKGTSIQEAGKCVWKTYQEIEYDSDPFEQLGNAFEQEYSMNRMTIGVAQCKLMRQRDMVDFAQDWLIEKNRSLSND